jgi:hypothetical protein
MNRVKIINKKHICFSEIFHFPCTSLFVSKYSTGTIPLAWSSYERPCPTKLTPGPHLVYPGLVSPIITRWQHVLSSSLDLIPRYGIALLFYTDFCLSRVGVKAPQHIPGAGPGYHHSPNYCRSQRNKGLLSQDNYFWDETDMMNRLT